ncbi:hypothetical protein C0J52_00150 [Blattella germanica]|nr:hypothetical protein C0J52_00150 [Blattella germanica]
METRAPDYSSRRVGVRIEVDMRAADPGKKVLTQSWVKDASQRVLLYLLPEDGMCHNCCLLRVISFVVSVLMLVSSSHEIHSAMTEVGDYDGVLDPRSPVVAGILWTLLLITGLHALACILLIIGTLRNVPSFVLVWIITDIAFLIGAVLGMFVRLLLGPTKFKGSIWKGMLVTLVGIYFVVVVKSLHSKVKEAKEETAHAV